MSTRLPGPVAIAAAAPPSSVEVDLWGTLFDVVPVTRSKARELDVLEAAFMALDETADGADDEAVTILGRQFDVYVKPAGGRRKKASDLIVEKWKGDELTFEQLIVFKQRLAEAVRPT